MTVFTAKPGIIIGRGGKGVDDLRTGHREDQRRQDGARQRAGDPHAGARRAACGGVDRAADREAHLLQASDASSRCSARCEWAPRASRFASPADSAGRKWRASTATSRQGSAAHAASRHRLRLHRSQDDLRPHRHQGLDLQGRHSARARSARSRPRKRSWRKAAASAARRRAGAAIAVAVAAAAAVAAVGRWRRRRRWRRTAAVAAVAAAAIGGRLEMLMPKKVKYRKQHARLAKRQGDCRNQGRFRRVRPAGAGGGLDDGNQIESARVAMTRHVKRGGQVWIRIFPDKPITKKPAETRMGKRQGRARRVGSRL